MRTHVANNISVPKSKTNVDATSLSPDVLPWIQGTAGQKTSNLLGRCYKHVLLSLIRNRENSK